VATERVADSFEDLRKMGIDVDNQFISVEESARSIKAVVCSLHLLSHGMFRWMKVNISCVD
jgi:hypothetical protein